MSASIHVCIKVGENIQEDRPFNTRDKADIFVSNTIKRFEAIGYECSRKGSIIYLTKISTNPHEPIIMKIIVATT